MKQLALIVVDPAPTRAVLARRVRACGATASSTLAELAAAPAADDGDSVDLVVRDLALHDPATRGLVAAPALASIAPQHQR